LNAKENQNK